MANRSILVAIATVWATLSAAKEQPLNLDLRAEIYESGLVHQEIMALKQVS